MKLYAFTTPGIPENAGYLKIGETNGSVDKRIKDQGHTLNTPVVKVWEDAVITERSCIDKRLHLYLREQGFHNPKYPDTGEYTELIKCTINDLKKAFDVVKQQIYNEEKQREYVGKQFYLEIRNWFYWTANAENASYSVTKAEYSLRLVIRLLLCFFLQEKELVPRELFDEQWIRENMKENEEYRYYNGILRNLFFHCLNIPVRNRKDFENTRLMKNIIKVKEQFQKIPFLNGGLFNEQEGDDTQLSNRYFFEERHTETIPELGGDCKVEGIVRILSKYQYKLTLDNLFDHAEYSQTIDPEFIGKVFESLLSCVDADTKENRRKITGSYYTPREIVDYMVGGALDAYLQNNNNLLQCKILDPACGSGAFPCGIMNEIVHRLDPDKLLSQLERYHIKLKILQNVIYGVDIQPMATQITVLRLFLALIQEITPDKKRENYGIEPLPNLETKIICADTLIGLKKEKQQRLELPIVRETIKQLQETRKQHFIASDTKEKERLKHYDETLRKTLSLAMEEAGDLAHNTANLLMQWNPYDQMKSTAFFDPIWMFGVETFDIVIGNPPYVVIKKGRYQGYTWGTDLYTLFYELSFKLLKDKGILSFITPRFFLFNKDNFDMRKYLLNDVNILSMVECKPFEAITENEISIIKKESTTNDIIPFYTLVELNKLKFLNHYFKKWSKSNTFLEINPYLSKEIFNILNKIEINSLLLKEISKSKRGTEIGKNDLKNTNNGKPILIGSDVQRYVIEITNAKIDVNHKEYLRLKDYFGNSSSMILLRRVAKGLIASISKNNIAFSKNLYGIKLRNPGNKNFILALLNSKLLNFYYKYKFSTKKEDVFPEIQTYFFEQLPITITENQQPIISLVDKILSKKQRDSRSDTSQLEAEVDAIVFHLYGLTESEIITVLLSLNTNETERRRIQAFYTDHKKHYKK